MKKIHIFWHNAFHMFFSQKTTGAKRLICVLALSVSVVNGSGTGISTVNGKPAPLEKNAREKSNIVPGETLEQSIIADGIKAVTGGDAKSILKAENGAGIAQQQRKITGTVTEQGGKLLPGVNVVVTGTTIGVMTDIEGKYSIDVPAGSKSLTFTFVGMDTQEIGIGEQTKIDVVLEESFVNLGEVVVVGYGTVKKGDVTGSVSSIRTEDMNQGVVSSVTGLMQGKAAGVVISQASSEPGGAITIQIRGAGSINAGSQPLYVIDGLPIELNSTISGTGAGIDASRTPRNPLNDINPADIESIEVLKDASATAIYGSRGANGVIIVTTKKGASGNAMKINYSGYAGIQTPVKMPEVLSPEDYMRVLNEILDTPGSNLAQSERVTEIQDGGTVWQDLILRNAKVESHNLSFSGGNEKTRYYASLNYFDQDGVLISSSYQRYDARLNLEHKTNKFLLGMNLSTSYTYDDFVSTGIGVNENAGVLYAARNFDPTLSVYNSEGEYNTSGFTDMENPLAMVYGELSDANNFRTLGTVFGEYTILKGWTAKINIGFDVRNSRRDSYVSRLTKDGMNNGGIATIITGLRDNYLGEFTSTYTRDLANKSNITAMGGISFQKFASNSFTGTGRGFPVDETMTNNMGMANPLLYSMSSSRQNNKLLSYIGRVNYNLLDKFLFTVTLRVDGSSRFGVNNKYGYFPSAAFAWKLNDYQFIKNLNIFNALKFRASIGRTGNQDISNYLSITTFSTGGNTILDGKPTVTLDPDRLANPDLKWETTEQINVGFDMAFLKDRITASVDYYEKNTYDMLFSLPVPPSTGYSAVMENIGNIKNNGFELTVDSRNLDGEFGWNTSLNLGTLKNRVTDIGNIPEIIHTTAGWTRDIAIIRVGETLNSFYGYKTDGVWQSQEEITASGTLDPVKPGDVKFVDMNGDHVVNASDRTILGNSFPKLTMGLTNIFTYRNFELNIFVDAAAGVSMLNNAMVEVYFPVSHRRNKLAEPYLNRWTPENPTNEYPSFVNPSGQGNKGSCDIMVEDASFIRLQSARLSYIVPLKANKIFKNITVYASAQNLHVWTKYSGQDPTTNSWNDSSIKVDFNSYPTSRTYILGFDFGF